MILPTLGVITMRDECFPFDTNDLNCPEVRRLRTAVKEIMERHIASGKKKLITPMTDGMGLLLTETAVEIRRGNPKIDVYGFFPHGHDPQYGSYHCQKRYKKLRAKLAGWYAARIVEDDENLAEELVTKVKVHDKLDFETYNNEFFNTHHIMSQSTAVLAIYSPEMSDIGLSHLIYGASSFKGLPIFCMNPVTLEITPFINPVIIQIDDDLARKLSVSLGAKKTAAPLPGKEKLKKEITSKT